MFSALVVPGQLSHLSLGHKNAEKSVVDISASIFDHVFMMEILQPCYESYASCTVIASYNPRNWRLGFSSEAPQLENPSMDT